MSHVTLEVEVDHGKIVAKEPEKLPVSGRGLLTTMQLGSSQSPNLATLEAFEALQRSLNLDPARAKAWRDAVREARR